MASLPGPKTVTYEEWLRMPEVSNQGTLQPKLFPHVQVPVAGIWSD
jgi:hypothetical protein